MTHELSSKITLSIVFLNYNRLAETRYTVSHLKTILHGRMDVEVIAIDNGSTDGTSDFLQTQNDWIQAICLPTNSGIAGYNAGFQRAQGDYILVLDDDSHPLESSILDRLIAGFQANPRVGIIACRIVATDGQTVHTWHLPQNGQAGLSMTFVGCGFAIRRELFAAIGWYPEDFFLYQNEMEVAIRVIQRGYEIFYDPNCAVIHRCSPQGRPHWRRVYYSTRNTIWIIRRYFPLPGAAYLIASRLCIGFFRALQAFEFRWYYQALKEAFFTPIEPHILPPHLRKQLTAFWRQNSIFHQLLGKY